MIYAYNTPGVTYHDGWTKIGYIGYTERQTVEQRIRQQTHTAGIRPVLAWQDNAMYKDDSEEYFTDHDFHDFLEAGIGIVPVEIQARMEIFPVLSPDSLSFVDFVCYNMLIPMDFTKEGYYYGISPQEGPV